MTKLIAGGVAILAILAWLLFRRLRGAASHNAVLAANLQSSKLNQSIGRIDAESRSADEISSSERDETDALVAQARSDTKGPLLDDAGNGLKAKIR